MDPISSEQIYSVELVDNKTKITISFIKPNGDVGGYYLYASSTGAVYTKIDVRVDAIHRQPLDVSTYDDEFGTTYYEYTFEDSIYDGRLLYCYIIAISTSRVESVPSSTLTFNTFPTKPTNVFAIYDGYEVALTWDDLTLDLDANPLFALYNVYRCEATQVFGSTLSGNVLSNSLFNIGKKVF